MCLLKLQSVACLWDSTHMFVFECTILPSCLWQDGKLLHCTGCCDGPTVLMNGVVCRVSEAPALGCAILAAVAAGVHADITKAVEHMVHVDRVIQPNPAAHQQYRRHYNRYKALYPAVATILHQQPQATSAVAAATLQHPSINGKDGMASLCQLSQCIGHVCQCSGSACSCCLL